MAYCSNCGVKMEDNAKFCGECGTLAANAPAALPTQSAIPATASTNAPPINAETASPKDVEATKRAENAKYAVDAAVDVAGSAIAATASVAASGAAIAGEISKRAMKGVNAANPETKKKVVGSLVLIAVLGAVSFGVNALFFSSNPEAAVREYYSALEKRDVEGLLKFFPESTKLISMEENRAALKMLARFEIPEAESKGGITGIEPICAQEKLSASRYNCKVDITYRDGSLRTNEHALTKINGSWRIN